MGLNRPAPDPCFKTFHKNNAMTVKKKKEKKYIQFFLNSWHLNRRLLIVYLW